MLGVQVADCGIRKMKTKWGSCNASVRRIWLNLEPAKNPVQCYRQPKIDTVRIQSAPTPVHTVSSFEQVISAPPVRAMPMVILTADLPPISADDVASGVFPPTVTVEFVNALWSAQIAAQAALARLFPGARHIINTRSHHYIHLEQPKLVINAIREVVGAVRDAGQ
jgi:hypothetical protein